MQSDDFNTSNLENRMLLKNCEILEKSIATQHEIIALHKKMLLDTQKQLEEARKPVFFFNVN